MKLCIKYRTKPKWLHKTELRNYHNRGSVNKLITIYNNTTKNYNNGRR